MTCNACPEPAGPTIALTPSVTIFSTAWPIVSNGSIVITSRDMTSPRVAMAPSITAAGVGGRYG